MSRTDAESKRMLTFKELLARTVREVDNQEERIKWKGEVGEGWEMRGGGGKMVNYITTY